jgi:hypothetical protein
MPEEPAAKRQRVSDFVLQPEDEFMAAHSGTSKIMVQVTVRHKYKAVACAWAASGWAASGSYGPSGDPLHGAAAGARGGGQRGAAGAGARRGGGGPHRQPGHLQGPPGRGTYAPACCVCRRAASDLPLRVLCCSSLWPVLALPLLSCHEFGCQTCNDTCFIVHGFVCGRC